MRLPLLTLLASCLASSLAPAATVAVVPFATGLGADHAGRNVLEEVVRHATWRRLADEAALYPRGLTSPPSLSAGNDPSRSCELGISIDPGRASTANVLIGGSLSAHANALHASICAYDSFSGALLAALELSGRDMRELRAAFDASEEEIFRPVVAVARRQPVTPAEKRLIAELGRNAARAPPEPAPSPASPAPPTPPAPLAKGAAPAPDERFRVSFAAADTSVNWVLYLNGKSACTLPCTRDVTRSSRLEVIALGLGSPHPGLDVTIPSHLRPTTPLRATVHRTGQPNVAASVGTVLLATVIGAALGGTCGGCAGGFRGAFEGISAGTTAGCVVGTSHQVLACATTPISEHVEVVAEGQD